MYRRNFRSFLFVAAQTRCNSAGEMHGLVESMCASSFGVTGIADGLTLETDMSLKNISRKRD